MYLDSAVLELSLTQLQNCVKRQWRRVQMAAGAPYLCHSSGECQIDAVILFFLIVCVELYVNIYWFIHGKLFSKA